MPFPEPMMGDTKQGAAGVEVLSREQVGVHDVSTLGAGDPEALLTWLDENGYEFPKASLPILDTYVTEGWVFVATRVLPPAASSP